MDPRHCDIFFFFFNVSHSSFCALLSLSMERKQCNGEMELPAMREHVVRLQSGLTHSVFQINVNERNGSCFKYPCICVLL